MLKLHKIFVVVATAFVCLTPANAATYTYNAVLSGTAEIPPNASTGSGSAIAIYDSIAHTLNIATTFSGLTSLTTAAHIHAATTAPQTGTVGVATQVPFFSGFPTGVTSGSFASIIDLTAAASFNPAFVAAAGGSVAGAEASLIQALNDKKAYFNIHTIIFPGGEIRGFFAPEVVPLPASLPLLAAGMALLAVAKRRRTGPVKQG